MTENELNEELGRKVFEQLMDFFVTPELEKRRETGKSDPVTELHAAQILFFSDGRKPLVRINSEVQGFGKVKLKPGITKKAGEIIYGHEVEELWKILPVEEDDPNCAHATLLRIGGWWTIAFDFRYNKALSTEHIETAEQFYKAAEFSFNQKNWSPFVDNLFSAAELLAKSTLLLMPDPAFVKKASHKTIKAKYNRFASLGNIEAIYRKTFNKLSDLRKKARYLEGDISFSEDEARRFLDIVKTMIDDARLRAER